MSKLSLTPVEPIGSREVMGFVDGPARSGVAPIKVYSYAPEDVQRGRMARDIRRGLDLSLRDVADALEIRTTEAADIERGAVFVDIGEYARLLHNYERG